MSDAPSHRLETPAVPIPRERLADFCRAHHIRRLALFGSVLRSDFSPESDVDVLVEFEPGREPGWGYFTLDEELSPLFEGRRVDVGTFNSLKPWARDEVLASALTVYAA